MTRYAIARSARVVALAAALAGQGGCTNVITPPPAPAEPRSVFVLDHGRHASLVLPAGDSTLVRYAYGDWDYYALRNTGPFATLAAAAWPTRAALGRREVAGRPTIGEVRRTMRVGIEAIYELVVEADAVDRLRRGLDFLFEDAIETRIHNRAYDLEFVHHPRDYTIIYNSNRVVAVWLRRLGCRVRGPLLFSRWRVDPRDDARSTPR